MGAFWTALLGGELFEPMPGWRRLERSTESRPLLNFQPVPETKQGKSRVHLDLLTEDLDAAVARVAALGGRETARHEYDAGTVAVLTEPGGHRVLRCRLRHLTDGHGQRRGPTDHPQSDPVVGRPGYSSPGSSRCESTLAVMVARVLISVGVSRSMKRSRTDATCSGVASRNALHPSSVSVMVAPRPSSLQAPRSTRPRRSMRPTWWARRLVDHDKSAARSRARVVG